jgi:hypothetical protein
MKQIGDNRRVLYNHVSIINNRCNYLRKIKSFREAGYDIVYMYLSKLNSIEYGLFVNSYTCLRFIGG